MEKEKQSEIKKYKSYHTIKKFNLGQTKIEVCISEIPIQEQIKKHLIKIYDVINEIAIKAEKRGVDTTKWFYTSEQIEEMKNNPEYTFI